MPKLRKSPSDRPKVRHSQRAPSPRRPSHDVTMHSAHKPRGSAGERGLLASDSIAAGEDIAMVPRSIALVVTDVSKCPCPDVVDPAFFLKSPRLLKLAITLLYERSLGAESKVRRAAPASSDLQSHPAPLTHGMYCRTCSVHVAERHRRPPAAATASPAAGAGIHRGSARGRGPAVPVGGREPRAAAQPGPARPHHGTGGAVAGLARPAARGQPPVPLVRGGPAVGPGLRRQPRLHRAVHRLNRPGEALPPPAPAPPTPLLTPVATHKGCLTVPVRMLLAVQRHAAGPQALAAPPAA